MPDSTAATAKNDDRNFLLLICCAALLPFLPSILSGELFTFRDHAGYFIPMRWFTSNALRQGVIPFWNPFNGSGEPWMANPQTGLLYPPALLFLTLPFALAYQLFLALHVALLGCGTYLLARRWTPAPPALLAAFAAMLCGPTLSLLDVNNGLATLAWLPFVVAAALQIRNGRLTWAVGSVLLTLAFLGGEPYFAFLGGVAYALILLRAAPRALFYSAAGTIGLSAVQLVPFLSLLQRSDRAAGLDPAEAFRNSVSPLDWLRVTLSPAPFAGDRNFLDLAQQFIPSIYVGALVVAGCAAALLAWRRSPHRAAVSSLISAGALFALLASFNYLPGASLLGAALRLNMVRYPARHLPLVAMVLCVLAAIGVNALTELSRTRRLIASVTPLVAGAVALALLTPHDRPSFAGRAALTIVSAVAVSLLVALTPSVFRRERPVLLIALLLAGDFVVAGAPFLTSRPLDSLFHAPFIAQMERGGKIARLVSTRPGSVILRGELAATLPGYSNLLFGQFDADTPAPVVSSRYLALRNGAIHGPRFDLLDLMSVQYLLTNRSIRAERFPQIDSTELVRLHRNVAPLPMVTTWTSVESASSDDDALKRTLDAPDATQTLRLSGGAATLPAGTPGASSSGVASGWKLNELTIKSSGDAARAVMVNQLDAPGWTVTVDGRRAEKLRAAGLFRTVVLPAGEHTVRWSYRPPAFFVSALVSLFALAVIVASLLLTKAGASRVT